MTPKGVDENMKSDPSATDPRILIIDDDEGMSYTLVRMVEEAGFISDTAFLLNEGLNKVMTGRFDVVFLDVRLPDGNGLDIVPKIQSMLFAPEIIIITAYGEESGANLALKSGAWDYLQKPVNVGTMELSLLRALEYRKQKEVLKTPLKVARHGIIGDSPRLLMCINLMGHAAKSDANVLILGETGTGKELFARAIHFNSARQSKPFIVVDCASLPSTLAESILFGHQKGAFTGADTSHEGLVKQADQGTLFLDEIGELSKDLQKKLLRVLQERRFRPVGSKSEIESDFRLISATNRDLEERVTSGKFRQDLLFRLRTFVVELPPVRERRKDIKLLADYYLEKFCTDYHFELKTMSDDFLETICKYHWPGNIREVVSTMESAVTVDPFSKVLFSKHLPDYIRINAVESSILNKRDEFESVKRLTNTLHMPTLKSFRQTAVEEAEEKYLKKLMEKTVWNIREACTISGLKKARLYQLLKTYGISK